MHARSRSFLTSPSPSHTDSCSFSLPFGLIAGGDTATMLIKKIAGINCIIMVAIVQLLFGYWKPGKDPLGSHLKRN